MSDLEQDDAQILKPKRGAKLTDEQKEEKRLAVLEKHAKKLAEAKDKRLGKNNVNEVKVEEKVEEKVIEPKKKAPTKSPVVKAEEEEEESESESEPEPEPPNIGTKGSSKTSFTDQQRNVKAPAKKKPAVKAPAVKKPAPNIGTNGSSKTSFTDQQRNVKKKKVVVYETESSDSESDSESDEEVIVKKPRGKAPPPQTAPEIRRCKFF